MTPGQSKIIRRTTLLTVAGAVLVTGCQDRLPHPATYSLVGSGSAPLPLTLETDSACVTQLVGGEMALLDRDNFRSSYSIQRVCGMRVEELPDPGASGAYRAEGDSVRFFNSAGHPAGVARIGGDSLVIRGPEQTLVFVRVPAAPATP